MLPTFLITAFGMAMFQTFVYRKRNQCISYDMPILLKFIVFLCSNVANALFVVAALLTLYLYIEFKHQKTLKVVAPFPEEHLIEFFYVSAFIMKVTAMQKFIYINEQFKAVIFYCRQSKLSNISGSKFTVKYFLSIGNDHECSSIKYH